MTRIYETTADTYDFVWFIVCGSTVSVAVVGRYRWCSLWDEDKNVRLEEQKTRNVDNYIRFVTMSLFLSTGSVVLQSDKDSLSCRVSRSCGSRCRCIAVGRSGIVVWLLILSRRAATLLCHKGADRGDWGDPLKVPPRIMRPCEFMRYIYLYVCMYFWFCLAWKIFYACLGWKWSKSVTWSY